MSSLIQVINTSFSGFVYAELDQSPTDFEVLRFENFTSGPSRGYATVSNGNAMFNVGAKTLGNTSTL